MKEKDTKLEQKISELENEITELTAGWQRTQADFMNYKKNAAAERASLIKSANQDLIEEILPILDNFALAAKHLPAELENNTWAQGVKQIEKQLENVLKDEGLERIESVGNVFDPNRHEAVDQVESDRPEGEIVEEVSPGYRFNGITIRPARVKVSKGK
jgi:molecular chaperone GrpE